ncbi:MULTISPECIES: aldehyde dehydrogenase family protein [unclassified Nocardia]|uniref:aldehyde dehydrogenase family protein n=1 Tax=unclassified Nocardia TaxID=2637762 RepID=UPI0033B80496
MGDSAPAGAAVPTGRSDVLTSFDPRTGEQLAQYPVHGQAEVTRAVRTARATQNWWSELGFAGRKRLLLDWRTHIARRTGELVELLRAETGKPEADAALEVMLAVENLDWAARNAERTLGRKRLATGWFTRNQHASVGYLPLGVVGVLGAWNNPVFTPMSSIAYAMAAGNAVVFNPHELTTGVGTWLAESWAAVAPDQPVLQAVTGDSRTATALCKSGVDKIAYAGPEAAGRDVIARCAQTLTPVVVEHSGKGSMIVHVDAVLDAAAEAAVFGAMANAGQNASGIQRCYVADSVFDDFLARVAERAAKLRPGADNRAAYGPMINAAQVDVVRKQVRDAIARGGHAVLGGLDSFRDPYVEPIVLAEVPEESIAITGEGTGPVLVVNRVADLADAVTRVNAAGNGIAVTVFTRDIPSAEFIAEQLRVGVVTVNSSTAFTGIPALPFGGVGEYGQGHSHGQQGLREFSRTMSIARRRYRAPVRLSTFDRHPRHLHTARALFRLRHGRA